MKTHAIVLAFILFVGLAHGAAAQMCGDCSGDQIVTVNELVTAVHNALTSTGCEECSLDCHGATSPACRCPLSCGELFVVGNTQFNGSFCDDGGPHKRATCIMLRCEREPSLCFTVEP